MKPTLLLVNGEAYWEDYFPEYDVHRVRLQTARWLLQDGELWAFDPLAGKGYRVDSILWRAGPVRPLPNHRDVLDLIRFSGIPCVNSADAMLRSFDRLAMLTELKRLGLPVVPFTAMVGQSMLTRIEPQFPLVLKVGNYHAGYGKMIIRTFEQWQDVQDMVYITAEYFTLEPYIDYIRDIRCMIIGEQVWAIARQGSHWKANRGVVDNEIIAIPDPLYEYTKRATRHFQADILALDILETSEGEYIVVESNEVPGISAFPESAVHALATQMKHRIEAHYK